MYRLGQALPHNRPTAHPATPEPPHAAKPEDFLIIFAAAYEAGCTWVMASSEIFDEAIGEFAVEYADRNERDYKDFVRAGRERMTEIRTDAQELETLG
jgi:hypothetical protein